MKARKIVPCVGIPDLHLTGISGRDGGETVSLRRPGHNIRVARREGQELARCEIQNVGVFWPVTNEDTVPIRRHV